ncbi:TPA: metal-dependent hydrolase, partial [Candidatus Poribacteria bacterium]|nr:metal-dependent hydrolase [Candidatus Poribacteria bacterium]
GIGGPVTYKKSDDLQTVAKQVPANRLLIETDCPWLAPQFRRGKRNEPSYVISVAERIAELRGTPAEEIGQITTQNFVTLFSNQNQ